MTSPHELSFDRRTYGILPVATSVATWQHQIPPGPLAAADQPHASGGFGSGGSLATLRPRGGHHHPGSTPGAGCYGFCHGEEQGEIRVVRRKMAQDGARWAGAQWELEAECGQDRKMD